MIHEEHGFAGTSDVVLSQQPPNRLDHRNEGGNP